MLESFKDKTVVITGGGGGLASELIKQLISAGANVAALDLNIETLESSDSLLPLAVDVTQQDSLERAIAKILETFGSIDILFNNAGITHMSCFIDTPSELFNTIMAVNFTGSVNITRLCLPHLIAKRGQIVAISSVAGFAPLYGRSAYSASKHAMEGFFRSLAAEVEDQGVSVLVVCPSFVKSRPELTAQVNAGISSPGAMKKSTFGDQISPATAAQEILLSTAKRQQSLYLGKVSKIAYWLNALLPSTYRKISNRGAKKEFVEN